MLSEVQLAEMSLSRIGVSRALEGDVNGTLASCTDTSTAKSIIDRWYARCRDRVLVDWPHTFARKFTTLVLSSDGTGTEWESEWDFAYVYPADCIKARRFVNDEGVGFWKWGSSEWVWPWSINDEWAFVIRVHAGAQVILTNVAEVDADLEYTEKVTSLSRWTETAASALAWLLAAEISLPLSVDVQKTQLAYQMYQSELWKCAAHQGNEQVPEPPSDDIFIQARRGK